MARNIYVAALVGAASLSAVLMGWLYLRADKQTQLMRMNNVVVQQKDSLFRAANFDTTRLYTQPVCLQFQGKSLLTIGQAIEELPLNFRYTQREGGHTGEPLLQYYSALADDSVKIVEAIGADSTISPAFTESIDFSTNERRKIVSLSASWEINAALSLRQREIAIQKINAKFPCLHEKLNFDNHRTAVVDGKEYVEKFELTALDNSEVPNWNIYYQVILKPLTKPASATTKATLATSEKAAKLADDKEQVQALLRKVLKWGDLLQVGLLPGVVDTKKKAITSLNLSTHRLDLAKLRASGLFAAEFIENYNKVILTIDKRLRNGTQQWLDGDQPEFGFSRGVNPWCGCQDVPYDKPNPFDFVEINVLNQGANTVEATWHWAKLPVDADPGWKDFSYKFRAVKENGEWKIIYLEGFDFTEALKPT